MESFPFLRQNKKCTPTAQDVANWKHETEKLRIKFKEYKLQMYSQDPKDFEIVIREPENLGAFRGFWVLIDKVRACMNDGGHNYTKDQVYEYFKKEANFVKEIKGVTVTRSLKRNEGCTYEDLINLIQFITKWAADLGFEGVFIDSKADQEFRKYFKINK
jgi:hypothetical protein